jgi:hypothetical protein
MCPDPKPRYGVAFHDADGTMRQCDADRPDIFGGIDTFEVQDG